MKVKYYKIKDKKCRTVLYKIENGDVYFYSQLKRSKLLDKIEPGWLLSSYRCEKDLLKDQDMVSVAEEELFFDFLKTT